MQCLKEIIGRKRQKKKKKRTKKNLYFDEDFQLKSLYHNFAISARF